MQFPSLDPSSYFEFPIVIIYTIIVVIIEALLIKSGTCVLYKSTLDKIMTYGDVLITFIIIILQFFIFIQYREYNDLLIKVLNETNVTVVPTKEKGKTYDKSTIEMQGAYGPGYTQFPGYIFHILYLFYIVQLYVFTSKKTRMLTHYINLPLFTAYAIFQVFLINKNAEDINHLNELLEMEDIMKSKSQSNGNGNGNESFVNQDSESIATGWWSDATKCQKTGNLHIYCKPEEKWIFPY